MKCTVENAAFLQHLQKVANIVSRRPAIPILSNIKLEAAGEELKLTANNLEIVIETTMKAAVTEAGGTTLPAKSLTDLANRLTGTEIQLNSDRNFHCEIICGNAAFKLLGLDPSDFPEPFGAEENGKITLKVADYNRLIDQVSYAVSRDDSRKILQGILFSVKDGTLTAAATDGKRLAIAEATPDAVEGDAGDFVIPHRSALEIRRLLSGDAPIVLAYGGKTMTVRIGPTVLTTKLPEGNFPDFRRAIPKDFGKTVQLAVAPLLASLELVSIPLSGSSSVELTFSPGRLKLHAESTNIGEGTDTVDIRYDYGEEIRMILNPDFLCDPLKCAGTETIGLRLNDENSPIALENGSGFTYILMPIRGH